VQVDDVLHGSGAIRFADCSSVVKWQGAVSNAFSKAQKKQLESSLRAPRFRIVSAFVLSLRRTHCLACNNHSGWRGYCAST